jgi:FkbM family methyltransferase
MGSISSLHLFGIDELIIFSFYWANRGRYKNVLDLGANIGLHSILLSKWGYNVRCYEPDPQTFAVLSKNLELNRATTVEPINAAVSTKKGEMEFVRVVGNMTGSHLAGAKPPGYGELEKFKVSVDEFRSILSWADLAKIDIEGHEKEVILSTLADDWKKTDALVEVGTPANAAQIFEHFSSMKINMFAQKLNWKKVERVSDMPTSYKEGTLFVTCKNQMPWNSST